MNVAVELLETCFIKLTILIQDFISHLVAITDRSLPRIWTAKTLQSLSNCPQTWAEFVSGDYIKVSPLCSVKAHIVCCICDLKSFGSRCSISAFFQDFSPLPATTALIRTWILRPLLSCISQNSTISICIVFVSIGIVWAFWMVLNFLWIIHLKYVVLLQPSTEQHWKHILEWYYFPWKYCIIISNVLIWFLAKCGFWAAAVITWPESAMDLVIGWERIKLVVISKGPSEKKTILEVL